MRLESVSEGALLAFDQLRQNKFRSGLTILGIVVGVATVMAMSAMIQGVRSAILSDLDAAGPKNFFVARFDFNRVRLVNNDDPWGNNPRIREDEADAIGRLPTVKTTINSIDHGAEFVFGRQRINVSIAGRGAAWTDYTRATIIAGHNMLPSDVTASRPVVLLSKDLAANLFGRLDPIGRVVRVNQKSFEVIGVFELSRNIFTALQRNMAIMPYSTVVKHLDAWTGMMGVFVVTAPNATQDEAMDQVITLLRTSRGLSAAQPNNFAVMRQEQMVETFNRFTGVFFVVMLALSSVALMVGGVGVVAIMMIAVTERTREIGIRKAIGATRREIMWQFLFEAVTVTVIGGVIGMSAGAAIAYMVASFTPIQASVPLGAVLAALGMAVTAGILFGIWPAWRAARMDPVVALRHE